MATSYWIALSALVLFPLVAPGQAFAVDENKFESGLASTVERGNLGLVGLASYYTPPYVPNACYGYSGVPSNNMLAAGGDGNPNIWNNGANCGKYFGIDCHGAGCYGGSHHIDVKITDHCPNGCSNRAFDLSQEAFSSIANTDQGVITVYYGQNSAGEEFRYSLNLTGIELGIPYAG